MMEVTMTVRPPLPRPRPVAHVKSLGAPKAGPLPHKAKPACAPAKPAPRHPAPHN